MLSRDELEAYVKRFRHFKDERVARAKGDPALQQITLTMEFWAKNGPFMFVTTPETDRDQMLRACQMVLGPLQADMAVVAMDTYASQSRLDPSTHREWEAQAMQDGWMRRDRRVMNVTVDALHVFAEDREGNSGSAYLPYRVKGDRVKWYVTHPNAPAGVFMSSEMTASGLVPDTVREAFAGPVAREILDRHLGVGTADMFGFSPDEEWVHSVAAVAKVLCDDGYDVGFVRPGFTDEQWALIERSMEQGPLKTVFVQVHDQAMV